MLPAGIWRTAGRNTLLSDHLKPIWRLLPIKRDGAAVKPDISHTAWWRNENKQKNKKTVRMKRKRNVKCQTTHWDTSPRAKCFIDTHLHCSRYVILKCRHWHTNSFTDTPADQRAHKLSCRQTHKQPQAKLSAWTSFFLRIFSLLVSLVSLWEAGGLTHHLNTDRCHWLTFSHLKRRHLNTLRPDCEM